MPKLHSLSNMLQNTSDLLLDALRLTFLNKCCHRPLTRSWSVNKNLSFGL